MVFILTGAKYIKQEKFGVKNDTHRVGVFNSTCKVSFLKTILLPCTQKSEAVVVVKS